jgi:hypothetical protein
MKDLIKRLLKESLLEITDIPIENETFSAYNGRYKFDVDMAYNLINSNAIKAKIVSYSPTYLRAFSNPDFSAIDPKKLKTLKKNLNLDKPLGIFVKFKNPEDKNHKGEWILIDGNHRVRAAAELGENAQLYVIENPEDVNQFMIVNNEIPHDLFPDD